MLFSGLYASSLSDHIVEFAKEMKQLELELDLFTCQHEHETIIQQIEMDEEEDFYKHTVTKI
jgi:hypothetical protein